MELVNLKNFKKYEISVTTFEIFSKRKDGLKPLKGTSEGAHKYFFLYSHGRRKRFSLWDLVQENWTAISEKIQENQKH